MLLKTLVALSVKVLGKEETLKLITETKDEVWEEMKEDILKVIDKSEE